MTNVAPLASRTRSPWRRFRMGWVPWMDDQFRHRSGRCQTRVAELNQMDATFHAQVADLLDLPELGESQTRRHHFTFTEYDHVVAVGNLAFKIGRQLKCDARACARAGLLHDVGAHWFDTRAPVALARRLAESDGVCHAIQAHTIMPVPPRTIEAVVVIIADFLTTVRECGRALRTIPNAFRSHLRPRDGEVSAA